MAHAHLRLLLNLLMLVSDYSLVCLDTCDHKNGEIGLAM